MQKRFEIISESLAQNNHLLLLIDAGRYHFNVLAVDHLKKEALAACNFEMDENSYASLADVAVQHEIFKPYYHKMAVVYNFPESILTPDEYSHADSVNQLDLIYGNVNRGTIISEPVAPIGAQNIYRVEQSIQEAITLHFPVHQYYHIYSVLLRNSLLLGSEAPVLKLVFYSKQLILLLVKDQQLQLVQSFPVDGAEDVSYYLLKLCNDMNLLPADISIKVAGWINTQSAVYLEIMKYFLNVEFESPENTISFDAAFSDHPLHFFSSLISLSSCVL